MAKPVAWEALAAAVWGAAGDHLNILDGGAGHRPGRLGCGDKLPGKITAAHALAAKDAPTWPPLKFVVEYYSFICSLLKWN